MLKKLQEKLGPGLLYAATAIGVSHLVSSTTAGATYGLIMAAYVVFMCLLKYPTFLFGARYTAATGESLIGGYERKGKWILYIFFLIQLFEYTFAICGVTVTTAALFKGALPFLQISDLTLQLSLVIACLITLAIGKYTLLENVTKVLVTIMLIGVVIAACLAFAGTDIQGNEISASITFDKPTILFLIAVAGWMPTGMAGAVAISVWVKAKGEKLGRKVTREETTFDFNLGYGMTMFTAACFVVMGTFILYVAKIPVQASGAGFTNQLMSLFTQTLGQWAYPIISLAAITVMTSTLLTLVDLLPRTSSVIITRLAPKTWEEPRQQSYLYVGFIVVELLLVLIVLLTLMENFGEFMQLVTSMGFVVAPIIAYLNHIVMFSSIVPEKDQPGSVLRIWSYVTIVSMTAISLTLGYLSFF